MKTNIYFNINEINHSYKNVYVLIYTHALHAESFQINEDDIAWASLEAQPCTLFEAPVATVQGLVALLIL